MPVRRNTNTLHRTWGTDRPVGRTVGRILSQAGIVVNQGNLHSTPWGISCATKEDSQPSLSERAAEIIMAAIFGLQLDRIQIVRRENVEMA